MLGVGDRVTLFLVLQLLRSQVSSFISVILFIFPTHLSRPIALCSVLSSALSFPISLLTLFSTISCGLSGLSVPCRRLGSSLRTSHILFVEGPHPQGPLFSSLSHRSSCWGTAGGVFGCFLFWRGFVPLVPSGVSGEDRVRFQPSASLLCGSVSLRLCWLSSG